MKHSTELFCRKEVQSMFFELFKKKNKENERIHELEQTIRILSAELEEIKKSLPKDEKTAKPEAATEQKMTVDQPTKDTASDSEKQHDVDDTVIVKREIRSLEELKEALFPFIKLHGGNRTILEDIVKYIYAKLGSNIYNQGEWYFSDEKIEYQYDWCACSFFDDGGYDERLMNWTMRVYHGTDSNFENHRLADLSGYSRFFRTDETFVCKDPFGLVGLFEFHYLFSKN